MTSPTLPPFVVALSAALAPFGYDTPSSDFPLDAPGAIAFYEAPSPAFPLELSVATFDGGATLRVLYALSDLSAVPARKARALAAYEATFGTADSSVEDETELGGPASLAYARALVVARVRAFDALFSGSEPLTEGERLEVVLEDGRAVFALPSDTPAERLLALPELRERIGEVEDPAGYLLGLFDAGSVVTPRLARALLREFPGVRFGSEND